MMNIDHCPKGDETNHGILGQLAEDVQNFILEVLEILSRLASVHHKQEPGPLGCLCLLRPLGRPITTLLRGRGGKSGSGIWGGGPVEMVLDSAVSGEELGGEILFIYGRVGRGERIAVEAEGTRPQLCLVIDAGVGV
jgi:hypothetical protein